MVCSVRSEALRRVVKLTREMLDDLRTANANQERIAAEFDQAIAELHTELRLRFRLSRDEADTLLSRLLSEVSSLVEANRTSTHSGVA